MGTRELTKAERRIIARLFVDFPWSRRRDEPAWQGCEMVNALCPDDLCTLPGGHEGTAENIHWLGTCAEPLKFRSKYLRMAPDIGVPHNEDSLIVLGWALQYKLDPREFEQWFGGRVNTEEMIKWPE